MFSRDVSGIGEIREVQKTIETTWSDRLRLSRLSYLSRTPHCLLERDPRLYNRPYKFERQGGSWLERWQREARRFLGKPCAWNYRDCEIEKTLLQRFPQRHMSLGRKRSVHAVPLQVRDVAGAVVAGEYSMDLVKCERRIRGGVGSDPFDDEIRNVSLHGSFPIEGGLCALCAIPPMHEVSLDSPSAHVGFQNCCKIHLLEVAFDGQRTL
jgi:hypothetical protein